MGQISLLYNSGIQYHNKTHQSMKLVVAKVWSIRELDTKLIALPPVGDEFSVKVQWVKEAVLLTSTASSGTKLSCIVMYKI